ncbi:MAG: BlaI/MecI/CopY family transcriptional regulator [Candidatus Omnitrophica bacterium]|nr:BlaI/MecI/CopY family transcriptional regulator [Candidatus Omnitrophota bacterium]
MSRKVSDAEREVLQALIDLGEGTSGEIFQRCAESRNWAPGTVVTFIRRLEAKGYVEHFLRNGSKAFVYRPTPRARSLARRLLKDLLEGVFGGDPLPLVSCLLEEKRLEPEQVEELRRLLDDHGHGGGQGR